METKIDKGKEKLNKFDIRAVQTLFRTLSRNHYNILKMIDNKSGIILTVNSIIISLLMGAMFIVDDSNKSIISVSARTLIIFSMLSMIFALIGMLPHRYFGKKFKASDYKGSLYAQNFSKQSLEEFKSEFDRIMNNGNSTYNELIKDLYFLGQIIALKQRILLISVFIFFIGLLSAMSYAIYNGMFTRLF